MEKLLKALKNEQPAIELSEDVIEKAKIPIERMLEISAKMGLIK
jgi:quinolinate synthase